MSRQHGGERATAGKLVQSAAADERYAVHDAAVRWEHEHSASCAMFHGLGSASVWPALQHKVGSRSSHKGCCLLEVCKKATELQSVSVPTLDPSVWVPVCIAEETFSCCSSTDLWHTSSMGEQHMVGALSRLMLRCCKSKAVRLKKASALSTLMRSSSMPWLLATPGASKACSSGLQEQLSHYWLVACWGRYGVCGWTCLTQLAEPEAGERVRHACWALSFKVADLLVTAIPSTSSFEVLHLALVNPLPGAHATRGKWVYAHRPIPAPTSRKWLLLLRLQCSMSACMTLCMPRRLIEPYMPSMPSPPPSLLCNRQCQAEQRVHKGPATLLDWLTSMDCIT